MVALYRYRTIEQKRAEDAELFKLQMNATDPTLRKVTPAAKNLHAVEPYAPIDPVQPATSATTQVPSPETPAGQPVADATTPPTAPPQETAPPLVQPYNPPPVDPTPSGPAAQSYPQQARGGETERQISDRLAAESGVDPLILWALVMAESGGNPAATGDFRDGKPVSFGLLQANTAGGRGQGHTPEQLMDAEYNLRLGLEEIAPVYQRLYAQGLRGAELAREVGRIAQRPQEGLEQGYADAYLALTGGQQLDGDGRGSGAGGAAGAVGASGASADPYAVTPYLGADSPSSAASPSAQAAADQEVIDEQIRRAQEEQRQKEAEAASASRRPPGFQQESVLGGYVDPAQEARTRPDAPYTPSGFLGLGGNPNIAEDWTVAPAEQGIRFEDDPLGYGFAKLKNSVGAGIGAATAGMEAMIRPQLALKSFLEAGFDQESPAVMLQSTLEGLAGQKRPAGEKVFTKGADFYGLAGTIATGRTLDQSEVQTLLVAALNLSNPLAGPVAAVSNKIIGTPIGGGGAGPLAAVGAAAIQALGGVTDIQVGGLLVDIIADPLNLATGTGTMTKGVKGLATLARVPELRTFGVNLARIAALRGSAKATQVLERLAPRAARAATLAEQAAAAPPAVRIAPGLMGGAIDTATRAAEAIKQLPAPAAEAVMKQVERAADGRIVRWMDNSGQWFKRMYHGTASGHATTDATKLDPDGLYGPAYYITDTPDVAGGVVDRAGKLKQSSYAQRGISESASDDPAQIQADITRHEWAMSGDQLEDWDRAWRGEEVTRLKGLLAGEFPATGPNVRIVDVPESLKLLDIERAAPPEMRKAAETIVDLVLEIAHAKGEHPFSTHYLERAIADPATVADRLYETMSGALSRALGKAHAKTEVNQLLADFGYDGIRYGGGQLMPLYDEAGKAIRHEAYAVFSESLPKITNALSGQPAGGFLGGMPLGQLGGAGASGLGANESLPDDPEKLNPNYKVAAILGALVVGGLVGAHLKWGLGRRAAPIRWASADVQRIQDMHNRSAAIPGLWERVIGASRGIGARLEMALIDDFALANKTGEASAKASGYLTVLARSIAESSIEHNPEVHFALYRARSSIGRQWAENGLLPVFERLADAPSVSAFNVWVKLQRDKEVARIRLARGALPHQIKFAGFANVEEARRAALAAFQRANPGMPPPIHLTGALDPVAEIDRLIQEVERLAGPAVMGRVRAADTLFRNHLDDILNEKVLDGMITRTFATRLRAEHPHYSPAMMADIEDQIGTAGGLNMDTLVNGIAHLSEKGHEIDELPPLNAVAVMTMRENNRIMKSRSVRSLVNTMMGDPKYAAMIGPKKRPVRLGNFRSLSTGLMDKGVQKRIELKPNEIDFFEGGERWVVELNNEAMVKMVRSLAMDDANDVMKAIRIGNDIARTGITRRNIAFALINAQADAAAIWVGKHHISPVQIVQEYRAMLARDPLGAEFLRAGGGQEGWHTRGVGMKGSAREQGELLIREISAAGGIVVTSPGDWARKAARMAGDIGSMKFAETVGSFVENAPRRAVFRQERAGYLAQGMPAREASWMGAFDARRSTIDFQRMGSLIRSVNSYILFLNAGIQGALWTGRTVRDKPSTLLWMAGLGAISAATYGWNSLPMFRRPDGSRFYDDVPDYVRDTSLVMMIPGTQHQDEFGEDRMHFVSIPLRQLSIFTQPVIAAIKWAEGSGEPLSEILSGVGRAASPVPMDSTVGVLGQALPNVVAAPLQIGVNKNLFSGAPIEGPDIEDLPAERRFKIDKSGHVATSPTSRALAKLTAIPGDIYNAANRQIGNETAISTELGPQQMEFFVNETGGGLAQQYRAMTDAILFGDVVGGSRSLWRATGGRILRDQGGQIERNLSEAFLGKEQAGYDQAYGRLQQGTDWQRATPEQRQSLIRSTKAQVRKRVLQQEGKNAPEWAIPQREPGEPPKYDPFDIGGLVGLTYSGKPSWMLEMAISEAHDKVLRWESFSDSQRNTGGLQPDRPTPLDKQLAAAYGQVSKRWTQWRERSRPSETRREIVVEGAAKK